MADPDDTSPPAWDADSVLCDCPIATAHTKPAGAETCDPLEPLNKWLASAMAPAEDDGEAGFTTYPQLMRLLNAVSFVNASYEEGAFAEHPALEALYHADVYFHIPLAEQPEAVRAVADKLAAAATAVIDHHYAEHGDGCAVCIDTLAEARHAHDELTKPVEPLDGPQQYDPRQSRQSVKP